MTIEEFFLVLFGSFLIGLSGAMMPGPVTTMTITETLKNVKRGRGWLVGPAIATGHSVLEISLMLALWFGASFIFNIPVVILVISLIGGAALIFFGTLGLKSIKKSEQEFASMLGSTTTGNTQDHTRETAREPSLFRPFVLGFVISATSAGWWAWWASVGLNAISLSSTLNLFVFSSFDVFITFYIGHIMTDYTWFSFISGIVSLGKKRINMKAYKVILLLTNLFLLGFGCYFIVSTFA
nr:LysE family transporter [Candidatus Sigynarchaeota archaeon]